MRGELGPINGDVVADVGLEGPHYVGIELALDPRPHAARLGEGSRVDDLLGRLPLPRRFGILWFANATTVAEAKAAEKAGADAIVAQGMEAGGHRGAFQADEAEQQMVGLMALLPQVVDAVNIPVIAAGGIADPRGIAAALILGASAVQIGTGFLRSPEAKTHPAYADRLANTEAHETMITRAFSGRPGRSVATAYVRAANASNAPRPAPYPVQRGLTRAMREAARQTGDSDRMQLWAGQSAKLAQNQPAGTIAKPLWRDASSLLS